MPCKCQRSTAGVAAISQGHATPQPGRKQVAPSVPRYRQTRDEGYATALCAPQTVDLSATVAALQQAGNAVGQAVGPQLQAGAAELRALAAPAQASAKLAEVDAAKKLVRAVGVDSNLPGSGTPASQDGDARTTPPGIHGPRHAGAAPRRLH